MTSGRENQYQYAKPHRSGGVHRRKRSNRSGGLSICILAAAILIGALACWKGFSYLWTGMGRVFDHQMPEDPVISLVSGETSECTDPDHEPPVLAGIHDFMIYQGDAISYMKGITATDDTDAEPTITVDNSSVDLSSPGQYRIIYTATDASGNMVHQDAVVTVLEKGEDYAELDTIYAAADTKLEEIIRENANIHEQIHDVYAWARLNLSYGGHSDRTDWRQTAYVMLTEGKGDCYGFWAVTKLLFERLEIPNIDVQKVKNSADDTDHFWSLVSLDGGESWYHFDSTPRRGDGDDFCLVTDAFIDAYSDSHEGSHNRDKSLYPETP